jgi:hypothetical protein
MPEAMTPPLAAAQARLWLARATAWSLLIGGWLALGSLGQQHLPRLAGGLAPLALWLLAIGLGLSWAGSGRVIGSANALRCLLLAAAATSAAALLGLARGPSAAGGLLLAALGWSALLLAASCSVRALRQRQPTRPPSPVLPALAGAALAWLWAGDSLALRPSPVALGAVLLAGALLLAGLLPTSMRGLTVCRAGLFDCSLPLLSMSRWQRLQDWPQAAAALSMLPMMVSLAVMSDWCASLTWLRGGAATLTLLHLAAMLGPALVLSLRPPHPWSDRRLALATATLLVAGGLALAKPGLAGLMAASLLQGMAWSLAWAGSLRRTTAGPAAAAPAGLCNGKLATPAWQSAALTAAAVLALGLAIDHHGPAALAAVQAVLALAGGLGLIGLLAAPRPPTRSAQARANQRLDGRQPEAASPDSRRQITS